MVALNALYYVASTLPLGNSTVTSHAVLFVPQWEGVENAPNDVVCFVGSANALEPGLKSVHGGGGADCTAKNGCGVHIHAGTGCADADAQGGHWYEAPQDVVAVDPWALVGYKHTGLLGYGQFADCVSTGFDLSSDRNQLVGRALVVHADDGSRVSCGLIAAAPEDYAPTALTADTTPIPGIEDDGDVMTGTVSLLTRFKRDLDDAVCYIGHAQGLEPDVESFLLGTGSQQCNVTNGCGAHIHAGTGCENKDAQGGHYFDGAEDATDPWAFESYYRTDGAGEAALFGCVITGNGARDYDSLPFIVHKPDGSRLLCGLLEDDDTSSTASSATSHDMVIAMN